MGIWQIPLNSGRTIKHQLNTILRKIKNAPKLWKIPHFGAFIFDTLILLTLMIFSDSSLRIAEYRHILSKSTRFQSNQALFTFLYSACQITIEQEEITEYLDVEYKKTNQTIELIKNKIQKLQEFKTRLISDVVTGKIDVRGIEIPEYEHIAEEVDSEYEGEDFDEQEE